MRKAKIQRGGLENRRTLPLRRSPRSGKAAFLVSRSAFSHSPAKEVNGTWTPDGRYFVFQSKGQIWHFRKRQASFTLSPIHREA
jgi:hypothetical protein